MARIVAAARPLDLDDIGTVVAEQLSCPGPGEHATHIEYTEILSGVVMDRTGYLQYPAQKNPANLRLAGRVRTEIADCVTQSARRLLVSGWVQLFYLGAANILWRRGLFEFRLLLAVPDQEMLLPLPGSVP